MNSISPRERHLQSSKATMLPPWRLHYRWTLNRRDLSRSVNSIRPPWARIFQHLCQNETGTSRSGIRVTGSRIPGGQATNDGKSLFFFFVFIAHIISPFPTMFPRFNIMDLPRLLSGLLNTV